MDKYADALPVNARITVDYTKPNNQVTFGYPLEERNIKKWVLSFIFPAVLVVWAFIVGISFVGYILLTNLDNFANIEISGPNLTLLLIAMFRIILVSSFVFIPPLLISFYIGYNYDKFKYWFPKFQAFMSNATSSTPFHTFMVEELKTPVFEIPLFKNVILSYEASGEFSKYLQRVEIREHDFYYEGEKTQWLWKAKFVFSGVPKSGILMGKFR